MSENEHPPAGACVYADRAAMQQVVDAACKSVDLERAWWAAKRKADAAMLSGDILTKLDADANHAEAQANCFRHTSPMHAAVDAYRANKAGTL
jgi:hypothetical protein